MKLLERYGLPFLQILLGTFFIFSGWAKLHPVEPFELTFVEIGVSTWQLSPFIARALIGLEFLLGVMLISHLYKRRVLQATIGLLLVFTVYLLLQLYFHGNNGDCGCFGNYLPMTPLQSIIKNIGLLLLSFFLFLNKTEWNFPFKKITTVLIGVTALAMPFILNPIDLNMAEINALDKTGYRFPFEYIYNHQHKSHPLPENQLEKGKYFIAMFSLTCDHCRIVARKIHILNERNPNWKFYFIFNGHDEDLASFFEESKTSNIPFCIFNGDEFPKMTGGGVPALFLVEDGIVKTRMNYYTIDDKSMQSFFGK